MATTLLFALEMKFVLKIERNAREFALRKWLEHSRSGEKHEMESSVSLYTSFVLWPLPACFTTERSTVKASLFVGE